MQTRTRDAKQQRRPQRAEAFAVEGRRAAAWAEDPLASVADRREEDRDRLVAATAPLALPAESGGVGSATATAAAGRVGDWARSGVRPAMAEPEAVTAQDWAPTR